MSAPIITSPLSADIVIEQPSPFPTLMRSRTSSASVVRMNTIKEEVESEAPEVNHFSSSTLSIAESEAKAKSTSTELTSVSGAESDNETETSPEVAEYVAKMREAIQNQGRRYQEQQLSPEIKDKPLPPLPVEQKKNSKRQSFLAGLKERGNTKAESLKVESKRLSTLFVPKPRAASQGSTSKLRTERKRFSMPVLGRMTTKGMEQVSAVKSKSRRVSVVFGKKG